MGDSEELSERFSHCTLTPISSDVVFSSPIQAENDAFRTTSYYMDSSGRSKCSIPLQLSCATNEDVEFIKSSGCLPSSKSADDFSSDPSSGAGLLRFEIVSHQHPESKKIVTVEEINTVTCTVEGNSIIMETELVVRCTDTDESYEPHSREAFQQSIIDESKIMAEPCNGTNLDASGAPAICRLEITALLVTKKTRSLESKGIPGLIAMEFTGGVIPYAEQSSMSQSRLPPVFLNLRITEALSISVRAVPGSSSGSTLVSLTMAHSNTHDEDITVKNIALHPGHSRYESDDMIHKNQSMPGGQNLVRDMSKYVKWGFAPRTEPELPLVIKPRESFSTVVSIDAGEDLKSRSFFSPVSVTAIVGDNCAVVENTDVRWTTGQIAVEPADAFRVDLSLTESSCYVGAPLVVSLRVLNLSTETRDLMLLMAKDEEKMPSMSAKVGSVNTAVVSEVNGYTFGVWGLSEDDDGTSRHNRDHELLAVDAALLLGEVKGQHSVDAELRFVPLREGTLDVPNLKLYDKIEGKWYNCIHRLKLVAAAKKE